MENIQRDTTKDLFLAALGLVKENGHYDKAAAIMDYVLPNDNEDNVREDIELSDYQFDFEASAQFGGSEGIYIDCFLSGKYTEHELKRYNHSTGQTEPETRRHIGTFKTLKDDVESFKVMGELCGALTFYAHQYVNRNLDRYTPAAELEKQREYQLRREAEKRKVIEEAVRKAPAGTFGYGGYHFTPVRPFYKGETDKRLEGDSRHWKMDARYAMRNMESDPGLALAGYSHEAFYAAAGGGRRDIFRCVENGKLYVPGANELFRYTEPPREERIAQCAKIGKTAYTEPDRAAPLSVFLLGGAVYDGKDHGAWVKLPASVDDLRAALEKAGARDGAFTIIAAESESGIVDALLPSASGLDELNMLAGYLKGMDDWEMNKLEAILHSGVCKVTDVAGVINLLDEDNFTGVDVLSVYTYESLGRYRETVDGDGIEEGMGYDEYGRYCETEEKGRLSDYGYVYERFAVQPIYTGEIPGEYRITEAAVEQLKQAREPREGKKSVLAQLADAKQEVAKINAAREQGDKPSPHGRNGQEEL